MESGVFCDGYISGIFLSHQPDAGCSGYVLRGRGYLCWKGTVIASHYSCLISKT